jgi:hypothetical protein
MTHPSMSIKFDYTVPLDPERTDITAMAANSGMDVPLVDPYALIWQQSRPGIWQVCLSFFIIKQIPRVAKKEFVRIIKMDMVSNSRSTGTDTEPSSSTVLSV